METTDKIKKQIQKGGSAKLKVEDMDSATLLKNYTLGHPMQVKEETLSADMGVNFGHILLLKGTKLTHDEDGRITISSGTEIKVDSAPEFKNQLVDAGLIAK